MKDEQEKEKTAFDRRVDFLIEMLVRARDVKTRSIHGTDEFAAIAIDVLKRKNSRDFAAYARAEEMRSESEKYAKNEHVDPFLMGARIGYAFAFAIVLEWREMTEVPKPISIAEGPRDGSCQD